MTAILVGIGSIAILGACLSGQIVGLLRQFAVTTAPTATARPTVRQQTVSTTTTPTATNSSTSPDWRVLTESPFGFRVDVPGVLSSSHGFFINQTTGQGLDLTYQGAVLSTPLQQLEGETQVELMFSDRIIETNICPGSGTPVTVGGDIPGRQQTDVPPSPTGPSAPYPYVNVSFVLHGVAIRLQLAAPEAAPQTFLARYSQLWRHMLASVAAVPGGPGDGNHPCG